MRFSSKFSFTSMLVHNGLAGQSIIGYIDTKGLKDYNIAEACNDVTVLLRL